MPVGRDGRRASCAEQPLGLLEIARARGVGDEDATSLPPGRRDASGFWFPARYDSPQELFTPQQRSLQARQRAAQARRGRPAPARVPPPAEDVGLPLLVTQVVPSGPPAAPLREDLPRHAGPQARSPQAAPCVDSSRRSV